MKAKWLLFALCGLNLPLQAGTADVLLELDASRHTQQVAYSNEIVVDYEVGLGDMRKVRDVWGFKDSERLNGQLIRYTWQVTDGFSAVDFITNLEASLLAMDEAKLLFRCDGRACGRANQWANRVFKQRLLYGKSDAQRYRVISLQKGGTERVLLYSSTRTADRQYLHAEYLNTRTGQ